MQTSLLNSSLRQTLDAKAFKGSQRRCIDAGVKHARTLPRTRVAKTEEVAVSTNGTATSAAGASEHSLKMLEFGELQELIKQVHNSDVEHFELKGKGFHFSLKTKAAVLAETPQVQIVHAAAPVAAAPAPVAAPAAAPAPAAAAAPPPPPKAAAPPKVDGVEMTSPMAGTFYRSPAPGEPSFIKEGDRVTKGQTVGIIEAMKLMNEIEAEMSGEVVKFLAENGSSISPGQPLLLIKP